jgi:hypothetical protein
VICFTFARISRACVVPNARSANGINAKNLLTYDFQTTADRPLHFVEETTYTSDPTILSNQVTRDWFHSLSAVLGGLIDATLAITMFRRTRGLALAWFADPGARVR